MATIGWWLSRLEDFWCWNIRYFLVGIVTISSLLVAGSVAAAGYEGSAKALVYAAAFIDMLVLAYVGRLPTREIHAQFIDTYRKGPWTASVSMPPLKQGTRIAQMQRVIDRLETLPEVLIKSGASREAVLRWSMNLCEIASRLQ